MLFVKKNRITSGEVVIFYIYFLIWYLVLFIYCYVYVYKTLMWFRDRVSTNLFEYIYVLSTNIIFIRRKNTQ